MHNKPDYDFLLAFQHRSLYNPVPKFSIRPLMWTHLITLGENYAECSVKRG